jgi:prenyltransferase beta subunit
MLAAAAHRGANARREAQRKMDARRERRGASMNLIQTLKDLTDTHRLHLDEMIVLSAQAKTLRSEYQNHEMEVPTWLADALQVLGSSIAQQDRDNKLMQLRQLEQEAGALMSRDEKRAAIASKAERLRAQLGIKPAEAPAGVAAS